MASTLEKLLTIQGAVEQQSMEALMEAGAEELTADQARRAAGNQNQDKTEQDTSPAAGGAQKGPSEAQKGAPPPPAIKPPPGMLEAWRGAYKLFTRYSPAIRAAAHLEDDNQEAGRLFVAALEESRDIYAIGGDAEILALRVFDMLDDVWKRERESLKS